MSKRLKLQSATRRIQKGANMTKTISSRIKRAGTAIWNIISWPFKKIRDVARRIDWGIFANIALLIAIIALFSWLIFDIVKCTRKTISVNRDAPVEIVDGNITTTTGKYLGGKKITLPRPAKTNTVRPENNAPIVRRGEITIDGTVVGEKLAVNTEVHGNLVLQNINRYTLPCGTHVRGNLIIRNVGLVRFCDDLVVTGDIYVSSRSSFGPIPRTARIDGQIIL
jgi:hypothetical protein